MSRGEDWIAPNGDEMVNIGGSWVCDVCGGEEPPNRYMFSPFNDDRHICKSCLTKGIVEYFGLDHWPEIILSGENSYVVHCREFKPKKRKSRVSVKLRREVLSVGKCAYCGVKENLQIDHIIPYSKGGSSQRENLQCLCGSCNSKKSNKIVHDQLKRILPESSANSQQ